MARPWSGSGNEAISWERGFRVRDWCCTNEIASGLMGPRNAPLLQEGLIRVGVSKALSINDTLPDRSGEADFAHSSCNLLSFESYGVISGNVSRITCWSPLSGSAIDFRKATVFAALLRNSNWIFS